MERLCGAGQCNVTTVHTPNAADKAVLSVLTWLGNEPDLLRGLEAASVAADMGAASAGTAVSNAIRIDPNKLIHIFKEKHNLQSLVAQFGSEERAYAALQRATEASSKGLRGVFEKPVKVGSETVMVRGVVKDNEVKIGTAFIPPK